MGAVTSQIAAEPMVYRTRDREGVTIYASEEEAVRQAEESSMRLWGRPGMYLGQVRGGYAMRLSEARRMYGDLDGESDYELSDGSTIMVPTFWSEGAQRLLPEECWF